MTSPHTTAGNDLCCCRGCYIAASSSPETRFKGSSGGFVSQLVYSLFDHERIRSAISYHFDNTRWFSPGIIHRKEDYYPAGSIYQDIALIHYIKKNLAAIRPPILIVCLPCQCRGIKAVLNRAGLEHIIVALFCSGQLERQATLDFITHQGIDKNEIAAFRYRGNGWPSGIQIRLKTGKTISFANNASDWMHLFHSGIYTPKRCYYCADTFGSGADIGVGDPWLTRYTQTDTLGSSLVAVHTEAGRRLFEQLVQENAVTVLEKISIDEALGSQQSTLDRKQACRTHPRLFLALRRASRTALYKKLFFLNPKLHCRIRNKIIALASRRK